MGLLATGMSCLAHVKVSGLSLVPLPPLSTSAFMNIPVYVAMSLYYHLSFLRGYNLFVVVCL